MDKGQNKRPVNQVRKIINCLVELLALLVVANKAKNVDVQLMDDFYLLLLPAIYYPNISANV